MKNKQDLISITDLNKETLINILDKADQPFDQFPNKTVANIFFEPSTRTRVSFELATKRLGATFVNLDIKTSATEKGEEVLDTIKTIEAMNVDVIIIRHKKNNMPQFIAENCNTSIINAGDGTRAHPTQALLDIYTIRKHKPDFTTLKVAIIGDVAHSRVARSDIEALKLLDTKNITLIGPKEFIPNDIEGVEIAHTLEEGIMNADVVMALRMQKERIKSANIPNETEFFNTFGLTSEKIKLAKPDAIIMHPGPMNRNIEIAPEVADGNQSVILEQVTNGVKIRMAVLNLFLSA